MRLMQLAILAGLLTSAGSASVRAEHWTTYANARFGTFADYPADRFLALPPPANGDGRSFQARDGATLAIYGANNVDNASPSTYESMLRAGNEGRYAHVTYRASGVDWLVLSGMRGSDIFYEKYLFKGDLIHAMVMTYPQSFKAAYAPMAARIARSLRAHKVVIR